MELPTECYCVTLHIIVRMAKQGYTWSNVKYKQSKIVKHWLENSWK